jgi:hypothetical protein
VLSYLRRYNNEAVLVVLNMSAEKQRIGFDLEVQGFPAAKVTTLLTTQDASTVHGIDRIDLDPFAVYIARLSR